MFPDLLICDLCLWATLNGRVLANNLYMLDELKENICSAIQHIRVSKLQGVYQNMLNHAQRGMLPEILQSEGKVVENIDDLISHFKQEVHLGNVLSELYKFSKIVMTIPVSTATAERSFSGLKRLKTYLHSTTRQQRLNSVSILHVHKKAAKALDLEKMSNEFISRNEQRKRTFLQKMYL
ncbi:hypothetical protein ANN_11561 [Periplaneta americana]|uniref:HAT C-terminal dimerisation domain-containing protein n=1 Tax=Periplaneta americana TaxID=6978 RepID=A0ABQ8T5D2_PERAM|nr:hypothetical protein ANN_11561 [Periplaneta americana]